MQPLVSIITIVYNGEKVLERTIQSIIAQTSKDYEYIIIDGGSKDSTLSIIEKYRSSISFVSSEPDKGLYDAMNKGLKAAKGKYVWFMNAGDEIYNADTLSNIFLNEKAGDVYYGEAEYYTEEGKILGKRSEVTPHKYPAGNFSWKKMQMGQVVCHQSFIVKKEIAPFYDLNHPFSSDIDWMIKCLKKADKTVDTGLILSRYLTGGISIQNHKKNMIDRFKVLSAHFGFIPTTINHIKILFRAYQFGKSRKS